MKDMIKRIILEWQEQKIEPLYPRGYSLYYTDEINTVIGIRRSGKTYILFNEIERLRSEGIKDEQIIYLNFDDERLVMLNESGVDQVIDACYELFPGNVGKKLYFFFDEIQNIADWHLFIKRLYEKKQYYITVTGSSSHLFSTEIATELRGRTLTYHVAPLDFKEFLVFKKVEMNDNLIYSQDRYRVINYADEYMQYGGFPRVVLEESKYLKKQLLKNYLDMIIYKDIVERYAVRNIHILQIMINYILENCAKEFSVNSFLNKFKTEYSLNKVTIFQYFSYLEEMNFLYYVKRFSYKVHSRYLTKKIYIADNGFISIISFRISPDYGRRFENMIAGECVKKGYELFYYKNDQHHECDFVLYKENEVVDLIQSCYELTAENKDREIRGIITACKEFKKSTGLIITKDQEEEIKKDGITIQVVPLWKWLL